MHSLYNISIFFFGLGIRIASLFNPKAKDWIVGRRNLLEQLPSTEHKEVIWFHCASLGEFDQGLPLMAKIKEASPSSFLLVTFFSPSGMKFQHKRKHQADHVMYLPLDTPNRAKRFINHFAPSKVFFVKYEFWSNHIFAAKNQGAKLYNISGLFRDDHRFFKWYGRFFRKTLNQFDWFFVQNSRSKSLLESIGIKTVSVSGDSRFDRVLENKKQVQENAIIAEFKGESTLFIIGSSWPEDEKMLYPWINNQPGKVLIAPHNVDETSIQSILTGIPNSIRYTKVGDKNLTNYNVLILDTIGQLSNAYSYGTIAYIGGGFSGSLHNILEPAVFGLPVIFGPKHNRFPEGQQFIELGIGFSVSTTVEFSQVYERIQESIKNISAKTSDFVEQNKGAAEKIWRHITAN